MGLQDTQNNTWVAADLFMVTDSTNSANKTKIQTGYNRCCLLRHALQIKQARAKHAFERANLEFYPQEAKTPQDLKTVIFEIKDSLGQNRVENKGKNVVHPLSYLNHTEHRVFPLQGDL